jgi:hypothetical protein
MKKTTAAYFKRWYDQTPELSRAVTMMERLSPEVRVVIAKLIIQYVRDEAGHLRIPENAHLRQVGAERIQGLMKAQVRKRWYDENAIVRQAFNDLYLVELRKRHDTAVRMIVSIGLLEQALQNRIISLSSLEDMAAEIFKRPTMELLEKTRLKLKTSRSIAIQIEALPSIATQYGDRLNRSRLNHP